MYYTQNELEFLMSTRVKSRFSRVEESVDTYIIDFFGCTAFFDDALTPLCCVHESSPGIPEATFYTRCVRPQPYIEFVMKYSPVVLIHPSNPLALTSALVNRSPYQTLIFDTKMGRWIPVDPPTHTIIDQYYIGDLHKRFRYGKYDITRIRSMP